MASSLKVAGPVKGGLCGGKICGVLQGDGDAGDGAVGLDVGGAGQDGGAVGQDHMVGRRRMAKAIKI